MVVGGQWMWGDEGKIGGDHGVPGLFPEEIMIAPIPHVWVSCQGNKSLKPAGTFYEEEQAGDNHNPGRMVVATPSQLTIH